MNDVSDLRRVEAKVDKLAEQVGELLAAQQRTASFFSAMTPIATQALGVGAEHLAELERKGYFDFAREALAVVDNVMTGYSPEDVHALADQAVRIVGLVRRLTQPEVLEVVERTADAAEHAADKEPPGVLGILKATSHDEEVRRGLMVAIAALRQVGRSAHGPAEGQPKSKLNPLLGAKRNLSGPRPATPSPPSAPVPTRGAKRSTAADLKAAAKLCVDGFLERPEDWTPALAEQLAEQLGVAPLTERHWKVIEFARAEYDETCRSPNIRRLTSGSGVPTKELYALFPRAPAKTAARIAGIPKPVGCI